MTKYGQFKVVRLPYHSYVLGLMKMIIQIHLFPIYLTISTLTMLVKQIIAVCNT